MTCTGKLKAAALPLVLSAAFIAHGICTTGDVAMVDAAGAIAFGLLAVNSSRRAPRRRHPRSGLKRGIIMLVTGILLVVEAVITRHYRDVMPALVLTGFGVAWLMHWRYSTPAKIVGGA